jgi:hypothetical protein
VHSRACLGGHFSLVFFAHRLNCPRLLRGQIGTGDLGARLRSRSTFGARRHRPASRVRSIINQAAPALI